MLRRSIPLGLPVMAFLVVVFVVEATRGTTGGFAADQPTAGRPLEAGELAGLPTPAATAPFGPPTQNGGAVTRSFKVTGLAPGDVLHFYDGALHDEGWAVSTVPAKGTDGLWRGQWVRNDRLLQVTAEPDVADGTGAGNGAPTSQLDLLLCAVPRGA